MDNGTRTLSNLIEKALPDLICSEKLRFLLELIVYLNQLKIIVESTNMIPISKLKMHETMIDSDFVVARGGLITLEVIAYKIPGY